MSAPQTVKARQFPTHIDIPEKQRIALCELLNANLADSLDLYSQAKQAHWNVKGKDFYQLHLLFDEIAAEVLEFVDLIAERCTSLGGYATGTVRMSAENSSLTEYPTDAIAGMEHVAALVERMAAYAARVRQSIEDCEKLGDPSSADMFTEISRVADKRLWFLEAHIQDEE